MVSCDGFMYKVYKGLMSPYLSAMFCLNETIHPHGTRHANAFHIVVHRTSLLKVLFVLQVLYYGIPLMPN